MERSASTALQEHSYIVVSDLILCAHVCKDQLLGGLKRKKGKSNKLYIILPKFRVLEDL